MKNDDENERRFSEETGDGLSYGSAIASKKQLLFLFKVLENHSSIRFTNIQEKYTKDSLKPLKQLYEEKLVKPYAAIAGNSKQLPEFDSETFAKLINKKEASDRAYSIHALAGLALYLEDKRENLETCADKIFQKTAWSFFLDYYKFQFSHIDSYIWYYWQDEYVGIAEMHFTVDATKTFWTDCRIVYYDLDASSVYKKNTISSEVTIIKNAQSDNKDHRAFSFYVLHGWQTSQYTIPLPADIQSNNFFLCSYASHTRSNAPISGIGLLMKYDDIEKKVKEININKKIDDEIYNMLYERNALLNYESPNSNILPSRQSIENIKTISGIWKAYNLRSNYPGSTDTIQSGIELNYLFIEPSGIIYLKCDENKNKAYKGFLRYPLPENTKLIKCNIQVSKTDKVYKMHLLLNIHYPQKVMDGVIAGWTDKNEPFATLIQLEKINEYADNTETVIENCIPQFIPKEKILDNADLNPVLLHFLRNKKNYLDLPGDCLPNHEPVSKKIFKNLAGIYYLLSRDFEEGLIDKAKLEIFSSGSFIVNYPDISYRGSVKEYITTSARENYIYLDIFQKKLNIQEQWSNYSGSIVFDVGNIFSYDDKKLSEKITTRVGLSLRKNLNNYLQVKKEILIPASDRTTFDEEISRKYMYDEEAGLIKNLKAPASSAGLSIQHKELLLGIRGKENNIMLVSADEAASGIIRDTNYFELYMNAFLFEILFTAPIKDSKVYNYLIQALLHVDNSAAIFTKLETIFSRYKTAKKIKDEIIQDIYILNQMIADANKTELINIIKRPLVRIKKMAVVKQIDKIVDKIRGVK
ncbi:MAG TPA: hypothetical protein VFW07_26860 [Parafilimonas sp.]|nr:hypothetical protein [Parafilimonas sp.]